MENCSTVEITRITEEVNNLLAILNAMQNASNSDRTIMIEANDIQAITSNLASVTNKSDTAILPNDLKNTINTVGGILRFILLLNYMHILLGIML